MIVGPSTRRADWRAFFTGARWDPDQFRQLVEGDDIGAAFFEIETQINGLYRAVQKAQVMARELHVSGDLVKVNQAETKARWLVANAERYREALGPAQRELDLALMRWMRHASCLSVVLGAGTTVDAGGPSWAELVQRLLELVLRRGHELSRMEPGDETTPGVTQLRRVVTGIEYLPPSAEARARAVLACIADGVADTEVLMEGAQICHDLLGQHLFTDLTEILYENQRRPGPIHHAIAQLAAPIEVHDRGGWFPGWDAIITYNFEDLMGEALDKAHLARAAYAMSGDEIAGDPNPLAQQRGQDGLHQRIYHLHGYTPRKLFLITQVRFVFSTTQYEKTYGGARAGIIGEVLARWLANPVHHALYVGCSFQDEAMNGLLRAAAQALPGRYHYALLRWPGPGRFAEATADAIAIAAARYLTLGVRPIWFDEFREIPGLIGRLA